MLPVAVELDRLMTLFTDMRKWLLSPAIEELFLQIPGYPKLPSDFFVRSTLLKHFYRKRQRQAAESTASAAFHEEKSAVLPVQSEEK